MVIVGVVALFAVARTAVDAVVQHDHPVRAGTVYDVGLGVTFLPAAGWTDVPGRFNPGSTAGGGSIAVGDAGVVWSIRVGTFTGTLGEFERVDRP